MDKAVENMNGGLILNALNSRRGGGSNVAPKPSVITQNGTYLASDDSLDGYSSVTVDVGDTMCEKIDRFNTIAGGYVVQGTGYTYRVKYGRLTGWQPFDMSYNPVGAAYIYQMQKNFDFYFCIYKDGVMLSAVQIPVDKYAETAEHYMYQNIHTWADGYKILPQREYVNTGVYATSYRLFNGSTWEDEKCFYNLEISLIFVYDRIDHNWTYIAPGEFEDNPTTSQRTYTLTNSSNIVPQIGTQNLQAVYTDLSDNDYISEMQTLGKLIHDEIVS